MCRVCTDDLVVLPLAERCFLVENSVSKDVRDLKSCLCCQIVRNAVGVLGEDRS